MSGTNSCWLFLGPEIGEKEEALKELRAKLSKASKSPLEEIHLYAGETPAVQMVAAMRNGSLFADSRLFLIKNAENIKKEEANLFAEYIASPKDKGIGNTVLVLISEESSISKTLEKALPPGARRVFYELSEQRKTEWVEGYFQAKGFRISVEGIRTILELIENNTEALTKECSRLLPFLDKGKEIDPADLEKWLSHTREESTFTLFSRIAEGDLTRSLESLRTLLTAKESPQAIFGGLSWCFRKLRDYLYLEEAGIRDEGEYRRIGVIGPQSRRDYSLAARRYNSAGAETCIALTAEYDLKTRSANTFPEQILMDEYLYKLKQLQN